MGEGLLKAAEDSLSTGLDGVLLSLLIVVFYQLMKTAQEHRQEYKEVINEMFIVVRKNTESNTKLCDTIQGMKEDIRYKNN